MSEGGPNVLLCGAWDEGPGYPRTASLRAGLELAGVAVRECRLPGLGAGKKALLRRPWQWPGFAWRLWRQRRELLPRLRAELQRLRPSCIVVPYPGHLVVADVARATDVPVVLDLFLSAYDTVVEDRGLCAPGSLGAEWLRRLDARACAAADLVLLDTPENAVYAAALTGLPAERFAWLPLADPDAPRAPLAAPARAGPLRLLFFGTGVPLHGLATLIEAVAVVPDVELTLVGGTRADRRRAATLLEGRLRLEPEFVDRPRLHELLAASQLVGGIFGDSGKAQRVVPWKLVHALAAGRPVLTADTPAVRRWLDGSGAVLFVPAADVAALAAMLRDLAATPERVIAAAAAARAAYDRHFAVQRAAERLARLLPGLPRPAESGVAAPLVAAPGPADGASA